METARSISHKEFKIVCVLCIVSLCISGCGFHLRGIEATQFPERLAVLRVSLSGAVLTQDPLLSIVRDTLVTQAGVELTDSAEAPELVLYREQTESRVIAVRPQTGTSAEYELRYNLSFRVQDAEERELVPLQTIRLKRDYTFDSTRVLVKEQEEQELLIDLRRDAAQQIVRRLERATVH